MSQRRLFATAPQGEDKLRKLKKAIDSEISYEEAHLLDYTMTFNYFQKHGWKVTDAPKSPLIELSKSLDGKIKIVLVFHAKPPTVRKNEKMMELLSKLPEIPKSKSKELRSSEESAEDDEYAATETQMAELVKRVSSYSVPAHLYISFQDEKHLKLAVAFDERSISIVEVSVVDETVHENAKKVYGDTEGVFKEMPFEELNAGIQQSLSEFISAAGIDQELGTRIQQLSIAKDQKLYYEFLKAFSGLVDLK